MDFVVAMATSSRPMLLQRTLQSLAGCRKPPGFRETIVVENGPKTGAAQIVQSAAESLHARYLHAVDSNKSAALNILLQELGDCFIFFTDDDVRFDPETLCAYADSAAVHGPGHFFGGPTSVDYEIEPAPWVRDLLPVSARGFQWTGDPGRIDQAVCLGFNWGAFSADLRAAGGFDPKRGPGAPTRSTGQETDMQRRLLARGFTGIYVPAACVWHYIPIYFTSPKWIVERAFRHGVERGLLSNSPPGLFGFPPAWALAKYFKGIIRFAVYSLSPSTEKQVKARFRLAYDRGFLHGLKQQK
jgi:glycosyltransferase involved in cell wall biosynthesis